MILPELTKRTTPGTVETWQIAVVDHHRGGCIFTTSGPLYGEKKHVEEWIYGDKDKSDTPYEQAQAIAQAAWDEKIAEGYKQVITRDEAARLAVQKRYQHLGDDIEVESKDQVIHLQERGTGVEDWAWVQVWLIVPADEINKAQLEGV